MLINLFCCCHFGSSISFQEVKHLSYSLKQTIGSSTEISTNRSRKERMSSVNSCYYRSEESIPKWRSQCQERFCKTAHARRNDWRETKINPKTDLYCAEVAIDQTLFEQSLCRKWYDSQYFSYMNKFWI